jgi:hypothetical protein
MMVGLPRWRKSGVIISFSIHPVPVPQRLAAGGWRLAQEKKAGGPPSPAVDCRLSSGWLLFLHLPFPVSS